MSYIVQFRGKPACPCQVEWIPAFEAELRRRGYLKPKQALTIYQLIGGNPSSGGTHVDGGASDFGFVSGMVEVAREMGADATWHRLYNWDHAGGIEHVHSVLTGCPHNQPAAYQITAVRKGFNGLGHLGQGAPDDGPKPLSGRTWQQGIAYAQALAATKTAQSNAKAAGKPGVAKKLGNVFKALKGSK